MKSSIEITNGLGRKLSVEVPKAKVASACERVYREIQKNANIKGFRKGKAPLTMIKSMYADRVRHDVIQDLVSEGYALALNEHKLSPISQPDVKFNSFGEDMDFLFTAEFEVRPEVKIKKYQKLKVEREQVNIDPAKVDAVIERIRASRAEQVPVLEYRPAQNGDFVELDFAGTIDGVPLEGGQAQNYKLELGSNSFIPGFEDGLLGTRPGQSKELNLTFPADYGNKDIAGKPVKFAVTVHKILKNRLPDLTDDFAKSLGGVDSLQALKDQVRADMEAEENKRIQSDLRNNILRALVKENPVEAPQRLLESQRAALVADVQKRLKDQGATEADITEYQTKWSSDLDETASFMVQSSFLIDQLAEELKLTATESDIEERIQNYAKSTGIELAKIKSFYADHKRRNQLEYQITEERVITKLIELADVKDVPAEKLTKTNA